MTPMTETTISADGTTTRALSLADIPDAQKWAVIVAANMVAIHAGNCAIHADDEAGSVASEALDKLIAAVDAMWRLHSVVAPIDQAAVKRASTTTGLRLVQRTD